jgi:pimeloyl-ACP methyl ester carboxylesterase
MGRGEPVVLVPGLAGSWNLLFPLAQQLSKRFRVIIPTLRGDTGVLGTNPATDISELAEDLSATLHGLGLERPTIMGVSFGGAVALEYAVMHPNRIGGLALWGVESRFRPTLGTTIARRVLERYPLPNDSKFLNQYFNLLHGCRPEPGPLVDFIVERCWQTDQSVVAHRLALLETFDVTDRLWQLDVPTIVMAGGRDVVIPPARQRALAESISGASFTQVDGAGHIGFLTHREEVAKQLDSLVHKVRNSYC